MARERADLVIVGAGTIGGWASVFAREAGLRDVVVLEREHAGSGASGRAAGMVRAQGGMPDTVRLGSWSIGFYRSQRDRYETDSGFMQRGYVILAKTVRGERAARDRIAMQRAVGLDARWVGVDEIRRLIPAMAEDGYRGGSYVPTDGWVDPPRNVRAYSLAMQRAGVSLREGVGFVGIRTRAGRRGRRELTAVQTSAGTIETPRVLLTGGPALQAVAAAAGARAWVGYVRHQVAVTEGSGALHADTTAMAFDLDAGLYWRPEEGGLLFGMSNPKESPGPGRSIDWPYLRAMERRLHRFVPATRGLGLKKAWAATIEYTPDHLPIVGPLVVGDGTEIDGASIASACGHGMMWGPAVSRIAVDLALEGATEVVERPSDLRMDRFDANGRSPLVDPIALPFPVTLGED
ncbi:MAG: FAD-binding oxidoreductase [Actinobacteria bacterium]|nr:MAG: FAD-binding oxidoreductase [Actinomycetota bacterium]